MKRRSLRKVIDEIASVRSSSGSIGLIKEEVWVNEREEIVKYSVAYVHHGICTQDNGRVLGYDNAHGLHERHCIGEVETLHFTSYEDCLRRFLAEVQEWRDKT